MSADTLLRAVGVSKTFAATGSRSEALLRMLRGAERRGEGPPAVDDVSIELARGDCLGIVGRNGAGKSTLLRILCGITEPDAGSVARNGRIAPMLELDAGFRPDFTGRENVLINAALQGMDARTARDRLGPIHEFSGIGHYFDRPVREYSSGMRARLAFSVAAHVDADVLVVDELLAVGDAQFQQKCRRFIRAFLQRGAVILVSHDDSLVLSACTRAAWIERGKLLAAGHPGEVLLQYRASFADSGAVLAPGSAQQADDTPDRIDAAYGFNPIHISDFRPDAPSHGLGAVRIDDVHFEDGDGAPVSEIQGGDRVDLVIRGAAAQDSESLIAGFILRDEAGQNLFGDNSFEAYRLAPRNLLQGQRFEARLRFRMPYLPVGTYLLAPSIIAGTQADHVHQCWIEEALVLEVTSSPVVLGKIGVAFSGSLSVGTGPAVPSNSKTV